MSPGRNMPFAKLPAMQQHYHSLFQDNLSRQKARKRHATSTSPIPMMRRESDRRLRPDVVGRRVRFKYQSSIRRSKHRLIRLPTSPSWSKWSDSRPCRPYTLTRCRQGQSPYCACATGRVVFQYPIAFGSPVVGARGAERRDAVPINSLKSG